jgi:glycogen operon protein
VDWTLAHGIEGRRLVAFTERLADLRRRHAVLRSPHFLHGREELLPEIRDIAWYDAAGTPVSTESWNNPDERRLVLRRAGRDGDGRVAVLTAFFNASGEDHSFRLPPPGLPSRLLIDSADPDGPERDLETDQLVVRARSVLLTLATREDDR